jgi:peptidoglycan hydrolase-like protein with peptidoglycan-binding domain
MRRAGALIALSAVVAWLAMPVQPAHAGRGNVAALQVALRALGYRPMAVDGISGPWTRRAVRRFQRRKRIAVDGIAGPQTLRKLGRRGRPRYGRRVMRRGQRGFDVAALQFVLYKRGFHPGGFDGGFGRNTRGAVKRFQRAVGLGADGVVGRRTRRALRRRVVSAPGPGGPVRFFRPLRAPLTSGFGRRWGRMHTGLDFGAGYGRRVGAAGRGRVSFAGWNSGGYGYLVVIDHRLGFESWYAHLSRISVYRGQRVVGGTIIGRVGSTGHSTGPHLHFEVRRYGTPIDPRPRMLRAAAARRKRDRDRYVCAPNADVRSARDADPPFARLNRCP